MTESFNLASISLTYSFVENLFIQSLNAFSLFVRDGNQFFQLFHFLGGLVSLYVAIEVL